MSTTEIIAITSAIAAPFGAFLIKLIDCVLLKWKVNRSSPSPQHEFIVDTAAFRKELRDEISNLRKEMTGLEDKLNVARHSNLILEREMARLRGQNESLRSQLIEVQEENAALKEENKRLAQRILELENARTSQTGG